MYHELYFRNIFICNCYSRLVKHVLQELYLPPIVICSSAFQTKSRIKQILAYSKNIPEREAFRGHSTGTSIHLSPLNERGSVLFIDWLNVSKVLVFCIFKWYRDNRPRSSCQFSRPSLTLNNSPKSYVRFTQEKMYMQHMIQYCSKDNIGLILSTTCSQTNCFSEENNQEKGILSGIIIDNM